MSIVKVPPMMFPVDDPSLTFDEVEWISRQRNAQLDQLRREQAMMMRREEMERIKMARFPAFRWDSDSIVNVDFAHAPQSEPDRKAIPRFGVMLADENEGENQLAKEAEAVLGYNVLRRKLKIPGKLGEVLAMLDIEPLKTEAVEKYKTDMMLYRQKELIVEHEGFIQFGLRYRIDVSWRRTALADCRSEVPLFALRKAVQVKKSCPEAILEVDELIEEKKLIDPFLVARLDDETYYLEVWKEPKFEETL